MYSYRYINQFYQAGYTEYSLIIEDLEDINRPIHRIEKSFAKAPNEIDSNFLHEIAKKEIQNIVNNELNTPEVVLVETEEMIEGT